MPKKNSSASHGVLNAEPRIHQRGREIQPYGTVTHAIHLQLEEPVRLEMTEQLNQLLADSMSLRDLYKKAHWQVAGPTFYQLHLLFDKHFDEQVEVVDTIAERIQLLGGLAIAMAADVAETTQVERPPRGREEVPVVISRLVDAHQIIIEQCRELAERASKIGDLGTNDMIVSDVLRTNELQAWFISEHLVDMPLVDGDDVAGGVKSSRPYGTTRVLCPPSAGSAGLLAVDPPQQSLQYWQLSLRDASGLGRECQFFTMLNRRTECHS